MAQSQQPSLHDASAALGFAELVTEPLLKGVPLVGVSISVQAQVSSLGNPLRILQVRGNLLGFCAGWCPGQKNIKGFNWQCEPLRNFLTLRRVLRLVSCYT